MTLNFPNNPSNGTVHSLANGATYTYDGAKWKASNIPDSSSVVQTNDNPSDGEVLTYDGTLNAAVWSASSGGGGVTVKEEGTALATAAASLNFVGTGVVASGTGADKTITITDTDTTYSVGDGGLTQKNFTTTLKTKLDGIEAQADVTDATNVAAAGAVMEGDTTTANMSFVVDEDDMASDLSTKVPTQQSVKKYVDDEIAGVSSGGIASVSADTTPSLGGDLDVNNMYIKSSITDGNVVLAPNRWGTVNVNSAGGSGAAYPRVRLRNSSGRYIEIKTSSGTTLTSWTCTLPNDSGDAGQVLKTNGSGSLSWVNPGTITLDNYDETVDTETSNNITLIGPGATNGGHIWTMTYTNSYTGNSAVTVAIDPGQSLLLHVTAGNNSVEFMDSPNNPVSWIGGTAPTLSTSGVSVLEFYKIHSGNTVYGAHVGDI